MHNWYNSFVNTSFSVKRALNVFFVLMIVLPGLLNAQAKGKIVGTVVDGETGEAMIGANVFIAGTMLGAATDIEGNYSIAGVEPGTYDVTYSVIGYNKKTVVGVEVAAGEIKRLDVTLEVEAIQTDEVVITAKAVENSEAGLLIKRQKSISVSDAISSEQFSRSGSGNAAEAVKQIVGASVVEGKEVYVRGLGDRYTSTQLNGAEIPSVDPYKRAGSVDIIPSSLVESIQAIKSFTPDKSGDFSGGAVDIKTKSFPEKFTFNFSASSSYNTSISGNSDMITVRDGDKDYLGYDDGSREIPALAGSFLETNGNTATNDSLATFVDNATREFGVSNFGPSYDGVPVNMSYSLSVGNQVDFLGKPFGFIASLTYKNNYSGYTDGTYKRWQRGTASSTTLQSYKDLVERSTSHDVLIGTMLKAAYKFTPQHIVSVNTIFNQNGVSSARRLEGSFPYTTDGVWTMTNTGYKERQLLSTQLEGQHYFEDFLGMKVEWQGSYLESNQDEPDLRYFYKAIETSSAGDISYSIESQETPERYYRYTKENQRSFKADFTIPFHLLTDNKSNFKFGGFVSNRKREFRERIFNYNLNGTFAKGMLATDGDIDAYLANYSGILGKDTASFGGHTTIRNIMGISVYEIDNNSSNYSGDKEITATYAMLDMPITKSLRMIAGARYENTFLKVANNEPDSSAELTTHDILPAASFIYNLINDVNLRFSYGKTLARPTYRELASFFSSRDFNGGNVYYGNRNLKRTLIDNLDLRLEWFTGAGEIIAVSGFYKDFKDPVLLQLVGLRNSTEIYSWTNVDKAIVYGVEFEVRQNLGRITESLSNFTFGGNVSFIHSQVDISESELDLIKLYDPDAESTRPFQGQSPYLVNVSLNYDNYDLGFNGSIYYNVFGKRLVATGADGAPDIYEQPFHLLNLSLSKKALEVLTFSLSVNNILNSKEEEVLEFVDTEYVYEASKKGTTISFGIKYSL